MDIEEIDEKLCDLIESVIGESVRSYGAARTEKAVYEALKGNFSMLSEVDVSKQVELMELLKQVTEVLKMNGNEVTAFCRSFRKTYLKQDSERRNDALWDAGIDLYNPNTFEPSNLKFIIDAINEDYQKLNGTDISKLDFSEVAAQIGDLVTSYQGDAICNVQPHPVNLAPFEGMKISGLHLEEGDIQLGDMYASTRIGKERTNQEDAVFINLHKDNPKFKILVVADGVGGGTQGECASNYAIDAISAWFAELDASYYKKSKEVGELLSEKLCDISHEIDKRFYGGGTTFVGAIVCDECTIVANVGDSRAYTYDGKENSLKQVSKDHSLVETLYRTDDPKLQANRIEKRDDMRFHKESNCITQCLGLKSDVHPSIEIVSNEYDVIVLVSDGVSDCMSEEDILAITKETPRDEIAKKLVEFALNNVSEVRADLQMHPDYEGKIFGGKDNTSAVAYTPEREAGDGHDL